MLEVVKSNLKEAQQGLEALLANEDSLNKILEAAELLSESFLAKAHVYSCGNGGSMCDAMHFAEELSGRFRENRPALGAMAISDGAYLSCAANDFGYAEVFSRFIEAHGRKGDVLVGISTSGKSENVIRAARKAKELDMKVICLTGRPSSALADLCDIEICTPAGKYADRVQELHIKVIHTLIDLVERKVFP